LCIVVLFCVGEKFQNKVGIGEWGKRRSTTIALEKFRGRICCFRRKDICLLGEGEKV
jgi:hypothetical protein